MRACNTFIEAAYSEVAELWKGNFRRSVSESARKGSFRKYVSEVSQHEAGHEGVCLSKEHFHRRSTLNLPICRSTWIDLSTDLLDELSCELSAYLPESIYMDLSLKLSESISHAIWIYL